MAMRSYRIIVAALLGWSLVAGSVLGQASGPQWEVYYQATFDDGSVRDLNTVPTTNAGLRRVVRISRYEGGFKGYEMLATGPYALTLVSRGKTVKSELMWNGRAWVARPSDARLRRGQAGRPNRAPRVTPRERRRVEQLLAELRSKLVMRDHEVAKARRAFADAEPGPDEQAAKQTLAEAIERRDATLKAIEFYRLQLEALSAAADAEQSRPRGQVRAYQPGLDDENALGLREQISESRTLPHRVQVWQVPPGQGRRTYSVAMAHPEAGPFGAFNYVAYADTDGDGRPDELLERSPLATADEAGGWTNWQFTTDEPAVFVGNAWEDADTTVYFTRPPADFVDRNWRGLGNEVFISGMFYGMPCGKYGFAPYLSNIRIRVDNPFGPTESRARIIVK